MIDGPLEMLMCNFEFLSFSLSLFLVPRSSSPLFLLFSLLSEYIAANQPIMANLDFKYVMLHDRYSRAQSRINK